MRYFRHILVHENQSLLLHMYWALPTFLSGREVWHVLHHLLHVSQPFTISAAMQDTHTVEHVEHLLTSKSTPKMCKSPMLCFQHRYVHSLLILWPWQEEGFRPGPLPPCVPGWLCPLLYHPLWNAPIQSGDWPDEYVTTARWSPSCALTTRKEAICYATGKSARWHQ